jgi:hypothetical protein
LVLSGQALLAETLEALFTVSVVVVGSFEAGTEEVTVETLVTTDTCAAAAIVEVATVAVEVPIGEGTIRLQAPAMTDTGYLVRTTGVAKEGARFALAPAATVVVTMTTLKTTGVTIDTAVADTMRALYPSTLVQKGWKTELNDEG